MLGIAVAPCVLTDAAFAKMVLFFIRAGMLIG